MAVSRVQCPLRLAAVLWLVASFFQGCHGQAMLTVLMVKDEYSVDLDGKTILSGKGVAVRSDKQWFSSQPSSPPRDRESAGVLSIDTQSAWSGRDSIGEFTGTRTDWKAEGGIELTTGTKQYNLIEGGSLVGFYYCVSGKPLSDTSTENATDVITNFPALKVAQNSVFSAANASFLSWSGSFSTAQLSRQHSYGTNAGPHVYVANSDAVNAADVVIMSYSDHFMSNSVTDTTHSGERVDWLPGISQSVLGLPTSFNQTFLVFHGKRGLTSAMHDWGLMMQSSHSLAGGPLVRSPDVTLEKIGYQTDNGAMYCFCPNDCVEKLLSEKESLDQLGVHIGYLSHQGDWWMGGGGAPWCVSEWEPNGRYSAMTVADFQHSLGVPIQLYAPYFCSDTKYASGNGGNFSMVQSNSSLPGCNDFVFKNAAPDTSYEFYTWLFQFGKSMGMDSYEPDFMNQNYNCVPAFRESPAAVEKWMAGMNRAAVEQAVALQWCYATPSDILASLHLPAVTNFRVSFDYYYGGSYNVGLSSLLVWALGAAPSKDTFWSTDNEPLGPEMGGCDRKKGCPADHNNATCELHTIITVLSTGPVGFSDAIGKTNATLLLRTCRRDGTLLKPAKAVTSVDATLSASRKPDGSVYSTFCSAATCDAPTLAYLFLSFSMKTAWTVTVADLYPLPTPTSTKQPLFAYRTRWNAPGCQKNGSAADCVSFVTPSSSPGKLQSSAEIVALPARESPAADLTPCLTTVWPLVCANGWLLLGELGKYVPLATQRFPAMYQCTTDGLAFDVVGSPEESVVVTALRPSPSGTPAAMAEVITIILPSSGTTTINLS